MSVQSDLLKERARAFGVKVLRLIDTLPHTTGAQVVAYQLAKSSTSLGANYVAACNGRSHAEFTAKLCILNEEADESVHWLRVIIEVPYLQDDEVTPHLEEAIELRRIFGRSLGTARQNRQR